MSEYPKVSLKAARINRNLTQEEAAAKLGIAVKTLQNYEDGTTIPQWDMVKKIEDVYQFPADFILFLPNATRKA
jgi:transcriptional regulator with XRE-family HTH domain